MYRKIFVILASFSLLLSACSLTNIIDTARESLPQVEEALPEIIEDFQELEEFETLEEEPVISKQGSAEIEATELESDESLIGGEEPDLDITVTERTMMLESDDPLYEIEIRYRYIEGDSQAISPFNFEMDYLVEVVLEVFMREVEESDAQRPDDAMPATSFLQIDYEMTYQSDGLYSVYLPITTYVAISAHPQIESFSYNYDALNREFLMPGNFFMSDAACFPVILERVAAGLVARVFGYQEDVAEEVLLRRDNWNFLPEGLRINFDAFEVGPGAAGPQFVFIPWEDLSDLLDLDGPAGRILSN